MQRELHHLIQGSDQWMAFRAVHFGASEAGAMLGISPKTTRDELLRLKHLGIGKEFSDFVQKLILDKGHEFEALALPLAEAIVGKDLFQVTMSMGRMSASCDGLSFDDDDAFEHKRWNEPMAELMRQGIVPPEHMPQCQQVLLVTGAKRLLFMLSDGTPERMLHLWVYPDEAAFNQLRRGWEQFESDLSAYVLPAAAAPAAVGRAPQTLPSVVVEIRGEVVSSNLLAVKSQAVAVFEGINRNLQTDQDFADAEQTMKWCTDIETRLKAAKAHALGQAKSIDEVFNAIDEIVKSSADARLALDKLVTRRKEERKGEIVASGVKALRDHLAALNERIGQPLMPVVPADFAAAIKNRRSFDNMTAAVNAEAARAKIVASEIADRIQVNLNYLREHAKAHTFLFADTPTIVLKAPEDVQMLVKSRITEHEQAEEKRREDERARIRQEEQERADREAREAQAQKNAMAMQEIQGIQQQVAIAISGRLGVRKGGTIECIRETLAETESWPITEENFGALTGSAQAVKDRVVGEIRVLLAEAEAKAAVATAAAPAPAPAAPAPVVAPVAEGSPFRDALRPRAPAPAPVAEEKPTMKLGDITSRLGFTVTADFLETLGYVAHVERGSKLYHPSAFPAICEALIQHITTVADEVPA